MTEIELKSLLSKHNGAIIAPAGHGKTEMITDIVAASSGKQLLLTHTNAGVNSLRKRLNKNHVSENKYSISTIAAFCIRWCSAYKNTAGIPDFQGIENVDYDILYEATANIFKHRWAGKILLNSYSSVIVDEYQDCTLDQHHLIIKLNDFLPVYVLGDPLQGIFDWKKPIVDWKEIEFEKVNVLTKPWRWENTNPQLGQYLRDRRAELLPALDGKRITVHLEPVGDFVRIITPKQFDTDQYQISKAYSSILYITKWPRKQLKVCQMHPWRFQYDETQEMKDLLKYAGYFDNERGCKRAYRVLCFICECATKVSSSLKSYIDHLSKNNCDFSRIRKYETLKEPINALCQQYDYKAIMDILRWPMQCKGSRIYRLELYREMLRTINYANQHCASIYDSAQYIRTNPAVRKSDRGFNCLSSRTLLSKGLEFDCVLIDMTEPPRAKDFYVALTRAKYEIIYISNTNTITIEP